MLQPRQEFQTRPCLRPYPSTLRPSTQHSFSPSSRMPSKSASSSTKVSEKSSKAAPPAPTRVVSRETIDSDEDMDSESEVQAPPKSKTKMTEKVSKRAPVGLSSSSEAESASEDESSDESETEVQAGTSQTAYVPCPSLQSVSGASADFVQLSSAATTSHRATCRRSWWPLAPTSTTPTSFRTPRSRCIPSDSPTTFVASHLGLLLSLDLLTQCCGLHPFRSRPSSWTSSPCPSTRPALD